MARRFVWLILIWFFGGMTGAWSQSPERLEKELLRLKGKEKIRMLNELAFQLMYSDPVKSRAYGRQSLELVKKEDDSLLLADTYNDASLPFMVLGDFDSLIFYNQLAYGIRMRAGEEKKAAANLSKIAQAWFEKGHFRESFEYQNRAYQIFLKQKDTVRIVHVCNNFGALFERFQKWKQAETWYRQSESWALAKGMERDYAFARINQGMMYRKMKRYGEAEKMLLSCRHFIEHKAFESDKAVYFEALGVLYRVSGRPVLGEKYYRLALAANEKLAIIPNLANNYRNLAYCLLDQGNKRQGTEWLLKAHKMFQESRMLDQQQAVEFDLYDGYKQANQLGLALYWLERHKASSDSVYNQQAQKTAAEFDARFEVEKHKTQALQKDRDLLGAQVEIKRRNQYLLVCGALLLVGGLVFFFYRRLQALERQRLENEGRNALNEERLRISRDLHDHLGADLTWISSELHVQAFKETQPGTRQVLDDLSEKTREAGRSLRDTIWAIHSEGSTVQEIVSRLAERSGQVLWQAGMELEIDLPEVPVSLGPAVSLHLYRMLKECVTNALKHSGATRVRIQVAFDSGQIRVSVQDNGKGLSEDTPSQGYGLSNLRERATQAGFSIAFLRPESGGLEVRFEKNLQHKCKS